MTNKFCVSLTYAKNDADKATVAFVVANAAATSERETVVFLSTEAVRLCQQGYADDIHEESFAPLRKLMANFVKAAARSGSARRASSGASSTKASSSAAPSSSSSARLAGAAVEPRRAATAYFFLLPCFSSSSASLEAP